VQVAHNIQVSCGLASPGENAQGIPLSRLLGRWISRTKPVHALQRPVHALQRLEEDDGALLVYLDDETFVLLRPPLQQTTLSHERRFVNKITSSVCDMSRELEVLSPLDQSPLFPISNDVPPSSFDVSFKHPTTSRRLPRSR